SPASREPSFVRQGERQEHRAAVRPPDFRRERVERTHLARAVAGRDGDVLLAVGHVGDGKPVDRVVGAGLPQDLTGGVVESAEIAIERAGEILWETRTN